MPIDPSTRDRIFAAAEQLTDPLTRTVSEMVRINTVNPYSGDDTAGSEKPGQLYLQDQLRAAGFATRLFEPPPDVYQQGGIIGPAGRSWKDRPNLVGELTLEIAKPLPLDGGGWPAAGGPGEGDGPVAGCSTPSPLPLSHQGRGVRTILLNCHMDTVGAAGMTIEPFSGEVRDGKIWGRGSSDSKGNLAVGLFAVRALQDAGVPLAGRIIFESVVDEECNGGGAGTIACCLAGYRGDAAICLDGIGSRPIVGCNGVLTLELLVHGRAGHAAAGAVNAIDKARVLADAMDALRAQRESAAEPMAVNLGVFQAGSIPAVVPSLARLAYNMTYSVAEYECGTPASGVNQPVLGPISPAFGRRITAEGRAAGCATCFVDGGATRLRKQIGTLLADACRRDSWLAEHPPTVTWVKDIPPYTTEKTEPIVRMVDQALVEAGGVGGQFLHMTAWSDACFLKTIGRMPTVGFGSASEGVAHCAVEYAEIDRLMLGVKTVALAIAKFLAQ